MPVISDLKLELDEVQTMKFISSAYTEASAVKLRNIRGAFEANRQFFEEISHVYHLVKLVSAKRPKNIKLPKSEDKTLYVAITSNQRFYGNLNVNIIRTFLSDTEKVECDRLVIGSTGKESLESTKFKNQYTPLLFAKDFPTRQETNSFLEASTKFSKVILYYPKFVTLITQTVAKVDITQSAKSEEKGSEEEIHIIFEPELAQILVFFERQVRALLFLRVMLEADLSRTAARLLTMSAAEERADQLIKEKKMELRKVMRSFINTQLLETFAGMSRWKGK